MGPFLLISQYPCSNHYSILESKICLSNILKIALSKWNTDPSNSKGLVCPTVAYRLIFHSHKPFLKSTSLRLVYEKMLQESYAQPELFLPNKCLPCSLWVKASCTTPEARVYSRSCCFESGWLEPSSKGGTGDLKDQNCPLEHTLTHVESTCPSESQEKQLSVVRNVTSPFPPPGTLVPLPRGALLLKNHVWCLHTTFAADIMD